MSKPQMLEQQTLVIKINRDSREDAFQSSTNSQLMFDQRDSTVGASSSTSVSISPQVHEMWSSNLVGTISVYNPIGDQAYSISISAPQPSVTIYFPSSQSASFLSHTHLEPTLPDHNTIQLEKERSAFLKMRTRLLATPEYYEKYVAILHGKVIDSDAKLADLAKRVYVEHGYVPILMTKVTSKIRKFENSSPETRIS
jgi:hypothetical protein